MLVREEVNKGNTNGRFVWFRAKRHGRNHFLNSVLKSNLITIVGSPDELEKTAGRRQSSRAQNQSRRN
jgi:hypothetical protein